MKKQGKEEKKKMSEFRFGDNVRVVKGFFEGCEGFLEDVVSEHQRLGGLYTVYSVRLHKSLPSGELLIKSTEIGEGYLEKVGS